MLTKDCERADLILTCTLTQRSEVLARCPKALRRTFTLMEFSQNAPRVYGRQSRGCVPRATLVKLTADARGSAPIDTYDVADPAGRSRRRYRRSADATLAAVHAIFGGVGSSDSELTRSSDRRSDEYGSPALTSVCLPFA